MEGDLAKIKCLSGVENWALWKFQLEIIFTSKGLYNIVNGDSELPVAPTAAQIAENANASTDHQTNLEKWIKSDGIARNSRFSYKGGK